MITLQSVPNVSGRIISDDLLGMESARQQSEARNPELARAEEAALREHMGITPDSEIPFNTMEGMQARGYLDADGNATRQGEDFLMLRGQGLYDDSGALTEKGLAYAMTPEDAELPDNLDTYVIRDRAGLNDKPDISMGDAVEGAAGYLGGALKGVNRIIRSNPLTGYGLIHSLLSDDSTERQAEDILAAQSFAEGAVESPAQLFLGGKEIAEKAASVMTGDTRGYYAAKQNADRMRRTMQDLEAADLARVVSDAAAVTLGDSAAAATGQLGDQRAQQIQQEGEAAGGLFGDPSNLATMGIGAAVGAGAKLPFLERLSMQADDAIRAALKAEELAAASAKANAVFDKTTRATGYAMKMAENARNVGRVEQAAQFEQVAGRMAGTATELQGNLARLQADAAAAAARAAKLADEAGGAVALQQGIQRAQQIGRSVRAAPAKVLGPVIEKIGEQIIRADDSLAKGLAAIGLDRTSRGIGLVGGLAIGGIPAVVASTLASGPLLRGIGNLTRILGDELMQARGSVPFWQRVAQNSGNSVLGRSVGHLMDNATLGGKVFAPVRIAGQAAKGIAAAAPVDIGFEILAEGGDMSPATLKQGLAESIVFAGPLATGGALVKGRVNDLRAKAAGDEVNLRSRLDPEEVSQFAQLPKGTRRTIAAYAGSFPRLGFRFTREGPSSYDRRSNTVTINSADPDAIKALAAHEVNHYVQVKGQIEEGIKAMLVGDAATGGMFRTKDGVLDPNFEAAMTAYNDRMRAAGLDPLSVEDFAIEYFTEATVNDLMDFGDTQQIQRMARRSDVERYMRDLSRSLIDRHPLLRDMWFRLGGAQDSKGKFVQGNGLLADGIREIPGARAMLKKALQTGAGRPLTTIPGGPEPITTSGAKDPGTKIPGEMLKGNQAAADTMFSTLKTDPDGNAILDADGVPEIIDKATDEARATAGAPIVEQQTKKIENGQPIPQGEISPNEDGVFEGTHLPEGAIPSLEGTLNKKQTATLDMLNQASKDMTGETFKVTYQPALRTTKKGKKVYDGLTVTIREMVPVGISITKVDKAKKRGGNILVHFFSVTKFMENVRKRAQSARGKKLYNGDEMAIIGDAEAVMLLHREGRKTDAYFADKYGEAQGEERKNFINTVFGLMTKEQKELNPLFAADKVGSDGVYRTYRIDRINQTTRLQGRNPMPFQYQSVKLNHFPNGVPVYHGTRQEFSRFDESKVGTGEGNQNYGWGLYFTENPEVANRYAEGGRTYEAELKPSEDEFLDFDKPVSQQSDRVRSSLEKAFPQLVGRDVSSVFVRPSGKEMSDTLLRAGIKGVKYIDPDGKSNNYVIFSGADAEMRNKPKGVLK